MAHELRLNRFCTPCITADSTIRVTYSGFMRTSGGVQDLMTTSCTTLLSTFGQYGTDMRTTRPSVKDGSGHYTSSQLVARLTGTTWEGDIMCGRNTNYTIFLPLARFFAPKGCFQVHALGIPPPKRLPPWCRVEQDHNRSCVADHAANEIVVQRSVDVPQ